MPSPTSSQKALNSREWYDFVASLAGLLPTIHMGGAAATDQLLTMLSLDETSAVLDVGCGAGTTACLIAERHGAHVTGIDLSPVMIEKAQARARQFGVQEKTTFRTADVLNLPFDDDSFDTVLIESVLVPFAGDRHAALDSMVRVLKPGGRLAANEGTIDPQAPPEYFDLLDEHPAINAAFTPESLRVLFEYAGLVNIQLQTFHGVQIPDASSPSNVGTLLKFMVQDYPRMLMRLLRDRRIRRVNKIEGELKKMNEKYAGFALIVGTKPA